MQIMKKLPTESNGHYTLRAKLASKLLHPEEILPPKVQKLFRRKIDLEMVNIRKANRPDDIAEFKDVSYKYSFRKWGMTRKAQEHFDALPAYVHMFIARYEGKTIGTGMLAFVQNEQTKAHEWEIKRIATLPRSRGSGVAEKMIRHIETYARELSIPALVAWAGPETITIFKKLGYAEVDTRFIPASDLRQPKMAKKL